MGESQRLAYGEEWAGNIYRPLKLPFSVTPAGDIQWLTPIYTESLWVNGAVRGLNRGWLNLGGRNKQLFFFVKHIFDTFLSHTHIGWVMKTTFWKPKTGPNCEEYPNIDLVNLICIYWDSCHIILKRGVLIIPIMINIECLYMTITATGFEQTSSHC